jgi:hypothetical protein
MSTETVVGGLDSLKKVDGGYEGWVWATEIDHADFRKVLAQFGEHRIKLVDSDTKVLMPIRDLQISLAVVDGQQTVEVVALIEGFVTGDGLESEDDDSQIERDVIDFFNDHVFNR